MPLPASVAEVILRSATHISVIATDLHGIITLFNPGAEQMLGYSSEEMVGLETPQIFHDANEVARRGLELSRELGRPIQGFDVFVELARQGRHEEREWTYVRKDRRRIEVNLVVSGLRDKAGELIGFVGIAVDITQVKQASEAAARTKEQITDILENSGILIQSVSPDGRLLYVNRSWLETLGYTRKEALGQKIFDFVEPSDQAGCQEKLARILSGENLGMIEVTLVSRDQRRIRLEGSINCSFESGVPLHTRGYFRDVTESTILKQRYELFFRDSLDLLCLASLEGRFLQVNPAWVRALGYTEDELMGRPFLEFVHPDDRQKTMEETLRLGQGESTVGFENRYRCKDGSYRWLLWSASPSQHDNVILATARDITDRIQLETKLRAEREQTRAILDNLAEAVITIDDYGLVQSCNPAVEHVFGYSADELLGQNVSLLMPEHHAAEHDYYLERYRTHRQPRVIGHLRELEGRRKDGTVFPLELAVGEVRTDEQKCLFAGVIRDITSRKRAEHQMQQARLAAEQASQAKSGFLATMSHELRTPLNAIIGFSELLSDQRFGELNERQRRYMLNILSSGRHLLRLINEVLDLSKIEAGKMDLHFESVNLEQAVTDALTVARALADPKDIQLLGVSDGDLWVLADPSRLKQVLLNLLSNAIKFTPTSGSVTVRQEDLGDWACIRVIDSGIGILPEDQERIFRAFEQVDSSHSRAQPGTGLGLALTRHLVELHGGRLQVESQGAGNGSTFSFTLPLARRQAEQAQGRPDEGPVVAGGRGRSGSGRALDPSPGRRWLLRQALCDRAAGYRGGALAHSPSRRHHSGSGSAGCRRVVRA